jgi:hypothetical protein
MGPRACRDHLSRPPVTMEVFGWLIGEEAMREAASVRARYWDAALCQLLSSSRPRSSTGFCIRTIPR